MKFLVDANLPPTLAKWLVQQGHQAEHASDAGLEASPDAELWARARAHSACLITKDEDFVLLQTLDREGPAVIWVRIGNATRDVLLESFTSVWPAMIAMLEAGEKLVELR